MFNFFHCFFSWGQDLVPFVWWCSVRFWQSHCEGGNFLHKLEAHKERAFNNKHHNLTNWCKGWSTINCWLFHIHNGSAGISQSIIKPKEPKALATKAEIHEETEHLLKMGTDCLPEHRAQQILAGNESWRTICNEKHQSTTLVEFQQCCKDSCWPQLCSSCCTKVVCNCIGKGSPSHMWHRPLFRLAVWQPFRQLQGPYYYDTYLAGSLYICR